MKKVLSALFILFTLNVLADCPGMGVFVNIYNESCFGQCDGGGVSSVTGGSGDYSINYYDNSFVQVGNGGTVSGLCPGIYNIVVQDNINGCFDTSQFVINPASPMSGAITNIQNATCSGGCDGSMTVTVTGGTAPYTIMWNDPAVQTTMTATGLCPGTYICYITDANGCSISVIGTISSPSPIMINLSPTNETCSLCDGSIISSVTGGTGSYVYMWNNGATTSTISNLCAGSYLLDVVDANGCLQSAQTFLSSNGIVTTASPTNATCNMCNGGATVVSTNGQAPYTYDIDSVINTDGIFTGLCPGVNIVTTTDSLGCVGYYTLTIGNTSTGNFTAGVNILNETGFNMNDGSIDISVSGGVAPYTFEWSNGATSEDIYSLASGNYSVWVTDSNGDCSVFNYFVNLIQNLGVVEGYLFFDNNQNCVYDSGDNPMSNQYVTMGLYWGYTNSSGYYSITVPVGNYTVQPNNTINITSGCNISENVTVTNGSTISNVNFGYFITPYLDVCVYTWSIGIVPGFNGSYSIYLTNPGTLPADGVVCIDLPSSLVYAGSFPSASSVNGNTICFNYANLPAGGTNYYSVYYYAPATLILGTPLIACVNASVTNGTDANPACNNYCYTRIVSGSFDPNDKTVSPSGENATGNILVDEEEFTYLVRFQNTGTGPAVNITITDTLTSMLDPLSFEMLNASHTYTVEFINGNIIRWKFENIMLPDSGSNEPGSHGHVQFRLNTANAPVVGQVIENAANIYFDFNAPVITNTAMNTYVAPNGVDEIHHDGNLTVYPNPADNTIWISGASGQTIYQIYDATGRIYSVTNTNDVNSIIEIGLLKPGIYFIRCVNGHDTRVFKFIKR